MQRDGARGPIVELILNGRSGTLDKHALAGPIESFFAERGLRPRVHVAASGSDVPLLARQAAAGDAEIVVAGGGDGTIAAVAQHIAGTGKTFGIVPLGTFNYFAKNLGVPLDLNGALEVVAGAGRASVNVAEVNGQLFLNNSSIGLYPAVLVQRESTYRRFGRSQLAAYASVLLVLLQPPRLLNLTITADGHPLARRTPLLFIGINAFQMDSFGIPGGTCAADGRLTLYVTHPIGAVGLLRLAVRALVRGLYGARQFEAVCADEILIGMRRRHIRVAMDGEIRVLATPLRYRMRREALRCAVPEARPNHPKTTPESGVTTDGDNRSTDIAVKTPSAARA